MIVGGYGVERASTWRAPYIALIVLAVVIAVGALAGIIAACVFWSRYKVHILTVYLQLNPIYNVSQ